MTTEIQDRDSTEYVETDRVRDEEDVVYTMDEDSTIVDGSDKKIEDNGDAGTESANVGDSDEIDGNDASSTGMEDADGDGNAERDPNANDADENDAMDADEEEPANPDDETKNTGGSRDHARSTNFSTNNKMFDVRLNVLAPEEQKSFATNVLYCFGPLCNKWSTEQELAQVYVKRKPQPSRPVDAHIRSNYRKWNAMLKKTGLGQGHDEEDDADAQGCLETEPHRVCKRIIEIENENGQKVEREELRIHPIFAEEVFEEKLCGVKMRLPARLYPTNKRKREENPEESIEKTVKNKIKKVEKSVNKYGRKLKEAYDALSELETQKRELSELKTRYEEEEEEMRIMTKGNIPSGRKVFKESYKFQKTRTKKPAKPARQNSSDGSSSDSIGENVVDDDGRTQRPLSSKSGVSDVSDSDDVEKRPKFSANKPSFKRVKREGDNDRTNSCNMGTKRNGGTRTFDVSSDEDANDNNDGTYSDDLNLNDHDLEF